MDALATTAHPNSNEPTPYSFVEREHEQREPGHAQLTIQSAGGVSRPIEATAFPLLAHTEECVGAIAIFWERSKAG